MSKYNWQEIKECYTQAPSEAARPTLEELAARYGCSPSHLREKAAKENWKVEAERFLQGVAGKRQHIAATSLAGALAEFDAKCLQLAQTGLDLIAARFSRAEDISDRYNRGDDEAAQQMISPKQVGELAQALERFQKIGKSCMGEDEKLNINLDYSSLTQEQLERLASGEDPRHVVSG